MKKLLKSTTTLLLIALLLISSFSVTSNIAVAAAPNVTSISVTAPSNPIYLKQTYQFKPVITTSPKMKTVKFTYASSNPKIATINNQGLLTAVSVGQASVKISAGSKSATVLVTIKSKIKLLSFSAEKSTITVGEQTKLNSQITMSSTNLPETQLRYTVTDPSIIFLDKQGQITALKEGVTDIIVTAEEKTAKIKVTVSDINWSLDDNFEEDRNITWSKDGKYVAIDQIIADSSKGKVVKTINSDENMFSQNTLYSFGYDSITAYDNNFKPIRTYELDSSILSGKNSKGFSDDGKYLFVKKAYSEIVTEIDLTTGEPVQVFPSPSLDLLDTRLTGPISISVSSNNAKHFLYSYSLNSESGVMFDTTDGKILTTIASTRSSDSSTFSADGKQIAILDDSLLKIWNVDTGTLIEEMKGSYIDADFSSDGRFIAAAKEDGNIDIYDMNSFELVKTFATKITLKHKILGEGFSIPQNVSFSPDGKQLLATYNGYNNEPGVISWNTSQLGNEIDN